MAEASFRPCVFCGRSTRRVGGRAPTRVRSFLLTQDFLEANHFIVMFFDRLHHELEPDGNNRICRNCFLRLKRQHQRDLVELEVDEHPAARQPAVGEPAAGQPDAGQPSAEQPDAGQPDAGQPDAGQPDAGQPSARQPDAGQPDAGQPSAGQPFAGQPDAGQPDARQPDAGHPNAGRNIFEILIAGRPEPENGEQIEGPMEEQADEGEAQEDDAENSDHEVLPAERHANQMLIRGYFRLSLNSLQCLIAGCNNPDIHNIPVSVRMDVLYKKKIFIPSRAKICTEHERINVWPDLQNLVRRLHNTFTQAQLENLLNLYSKALKTRFNFDEINSMDEITYHYYTGLNKDQLMIILSETPSLRQNFKKPLKALSMVLTKLHTGDSNERLAVIFSVTRKILERNMKKARECLESEFVPKYLGYNHMTRENLLSRILSIPNHLYGMAADGQGRPAITIADGTYLYVQKSSNYSFQRRTYSLHKYRNLLKTFLFVCPDGHIIEIYGPYEATKSDAQILNEIINNPEDLFHSFFRENDVFILDRGFRDVMPELRHERYRAYMPLTREQGQSQLTTQQANYSRKVTLCRWVQTQVCIKICPPERPYGGQRS